MELKDELTLKCELTMEVTSENELIKSKSILITSYKSRLFGIFHSSKKLQREA